MEPTSPAMAVAEAIVDRRSAGRPVIVGLGGSVAVGKSTLAASVASALRSRGDGSVTVLATDGFLFPNDVLAARGLLDRKGEPNTYDEAALLAVLGAVRAGAPTVSVPSYSHRTFDVERAQPVDVGDVVIVEGVNALQPGLVGAYDLSVFLDADSDVVVAWFIERFLGLVEAAEVDATSFYRRFVSQTPDARRATAEMVWSTINGPNVDRFVLPTKHSADLVVSVDAAHALTSVVRQSGA